MSSLLFPTLAGISGLDVTRNYVWKTAVQEAISGKTTAVGLRTYPLVHYELVVEMMRNYSSPSELLQLQGLYNAVHGRGDTFLYSDPEFNTVIHQQIGIGDGATANFQTIATFQNQSANLLTWSNGFTVDPPWTTSVCTLSGTSTVSPDGSLDATRVTATGTSGYVASNLGQASVLPLTPYTFSIWVRSISGTQAQTLVIQDQTGAVIVAHSIVATTTWQRFSCTGTMLSGSSSAYGLLGGSGGGFNTGDMCEIFGAQLELGTTPSTYVPTTTNGALGPGAPELIQNFNGLSQYFVNGTLQTFGTAYTLSGTGLVTFLPGHIPAANAVITWTGSFYYRCRFDEDEVVWAKFMTVGLWTVKKLMFTSVKL